MISKKVRRYSQRTLPKGMLIRVGVDRGNWFERIPERARIPDNALGPVFANGTFEFVPKSEENRISKSELKTKDWKGFKTYEDILGKSGKPLSTYLPDRLWKRHPHRDPEFEMFSYGDPTGKRRYLLKLHRGDVLAFYSGLRRFDDEKHKEALYIIGYFTVKKVIDFNKLSQAEIEECRRLYANNAHMNRKDVEPNLVLVIGDQSKSRLLMEAVLISQQKTAKDGRTYKAVSKRMEKLLGIKGFIQTSLPRLITNKENVKNLKRLLGIDVKSKGKFGRKPKKKQKLGLAAPER